MSNRIVFGFSRPKYNWPPPLFAWAIMAFESLTSLKMVNYSHAYVRFYSNEWDREIVYQASGSKVNFISWDRFQKIEVIVHEFEIPVSDETMKKTAQFCVDSLGSGYALIGAFGMVLVRMARLFGSKIRNPITQGGYWCSEAAATILKDRLGAKISQDDIRDMLPTDVCNYLVDSGAK